MRGTDWRGKDCNDYDHTIYPGRNTSTHSVCQHATTSHIHNLTCARLMLIITVMGSLEQTHKVVHMRMCYALTVNHEALQCWEIVQQRSSIFLICLDQCLHSNGPNALKMKWIIHNVHGRRVIFRPQSVHHHPRVWTAFTWDYGKGIIATSVITLYVCWVSMVWQNV